MNGPRAGSTNDPDGRLFDYYHSKSQTSETRLNDPALDAMIDRERATLNQDERYKACIDIQQYIADKMYMVGFLPYQYNHVALQPGVKNYYPGGSTSEAGGSESVSRLWIER